MTGDPTQGQNENGNWGDGDGKKKEKKKSFFSLKKDSKQKQKMKKEKEGRKKERKEKEKEKDRGGEEDPQSEIIIFEEPDTNNQPMSELFDDRLNQVTSDLAQLGEQDETFHEPMSMASQLPKVTQFYVSQYERNPDETYGEGFRLGISACLKYGLGYVMKYVKEHQQFPP